MKNCTESSENKKYPLPVFLILDGHRCLIVGGGDVAKRKVEDVIESGGITTVVAEVPSPEMLKLAEDGKITLEVRSFVPGDLDDIYLVFAATDDMSVNAEIAGIARQRGIIVNAVDDPERCDFYSGAVVKRGPLRIAISTNGMSPFLASGIRRELESRFPESYSDFITAAGKMRKHILSMDNLDLDKKHNALRWIAQKDTFALFNETGIDNIWIELSKIISS